jgi:hypothetical protein
MSPMRIAFFLPIPSKYFPIKGEHINAESSKQLLNKLERRFIYLSINAVLIDVSPECFSGIYVGKIFSTFKKRVCVVNKENRHAISTFLRSNPRLSTNFSFSSTDMAWCREWSRRRGPPRPFTNDIFVLFSFS